MTDPPSVLFESLACDGYCIVDAADNTVVDAADVLLEWFEQPASVKQAAATAGSEAAAAAGRGFFSLPDKEVLEVKQHWRPDAVKGAVRLAATSVSSKREGSVTNPSSNHVIGPLLRAALCKVYQRFSNTRVQRVCETLAHMKYSSILK
jgi:hypothetical protein